MKFKIEDIEYDAEPIPGLSNYFASRCGRVIRYYAGKYRVMKGSVLNGYIRVDLRKNRKNTGGLVFVHRLIALTFLGKVPKGNQVNHKNFKRNDNRIDNLEYCTRQQNIDHAVKGNRLNPSRGENHYRSIYKKSMIYRLKKDIKSGLSYKELMKKYNVNKHLIYDVKHEKSWKHVKLKKE